MRETGGQEEEESARVLLEWMYSVYRAQTLYVAAKLGLADHFADGPMTATRLAAAVGADPVSLLRFMRVLVSMGVFSGDDRTGYSLTELGARLRTDARGSMRDYVITYGELFFPAWLDPVPTAITGKPGFDTTFGANLFDYLGEHPELARRFDGAMAGTALFAAALPHVYDFSGAATIVDIGGGQGALLAEVLRAYPNARGVLYDASHVVAAAEPHLRRAGMADRCDRVAGDFAVSVPAGGDVYLLSRILHDWDDAMCHTILRNIRAATQPGATLLIVERVIHDRPTLALDSDVLMMMVTGGRERTRAEYDELLAPNSFQVNECRSLPLDVNVLVAERMP